MIKKLKKKYPPAVLERDIKKGRIIQNKRETGFKGLIQMAVEFFNSCEQTDLFGVCAQMAFTLLFALLPTLLFIILICSAFVPNFESMFYSLIRILVPSTSFDYISQEIGHLLSYVNRIGGFILFLSALMGTLSAHTFLVGINQTYGFDLYRSKRWEWFKSFLVLLIFILTLSGMTSLFIYTCHIAEVTLVSGVPFITSMGFNTVFFDIMLIAGIFIVLTGFYVFTPERRIRLREALPGAVFSTLGILIVFRIYVEILNHSKNYLTVYGSLSGLFVLLTAFYFVCVILNLGAKVNVFFSFKKITDRYDKITMV